VSSVFAGEGGCGVGDCGGGATGFDDATDVALDAGAGAFMSSSFGGCVWMTGGRCGADTLGGGAVDVVDGACCTGAG